MEECRLRAFENGVLRRIFGSKGNEVTDMNGACIEYRGEK